ncbi:hypothetical protein [Devosia salina]|uniref:RepB family plasmid replication initiator protein n=1 Tax=Devosia salina TaxID=2860336 RepID=A0ABX8WK63_9HYPH|nr:hypothetical protein [Devosia salina]QYO78391.1 hypothetical protein K1X15_07550 [Devosia salina]
MPSIAVSVPLALASGRMLTGLTAPAYRAALVLISRAGNGSSFSITKPELEQLAGLRLDNADRLLERLRSSTLAVDGVAVPAFDSIEYTPGVQKRLAGIISGTISPEFMDEISRLQWRGQKVSLDTGELVKLTTVPGILLWLRLAIERQSGSNEDFRLRLTDMDAVAIFGPYAQRAAIKRTTKSEGTFQWTSLSRIHEQLIAPAVKDLWTAIDGQVVDARPAVPERGRGRAWSYVEISMSKLRAVPSLRELNEAMKAKAEYDERKHIVTDPAKAREADG